MPRQDIEYMDHSFPLLEIRQSLLEVWTAGSRTPIPIHIQRYTTLTHGGLTQYNHSFIPILKLLHVTLATNPSVMKDNHGLLQIEYEEGIKQP
jgi:hypothetical protein